ncbi:nuclear transport factor 2 family protein [Lactobacillus sp. A27]|uniref:nuclear transport factor 2 family protein n=1 Tax=Lactobacillus sp. A27 TaxID=2796363 RepID=UPI00191DAF08|nr:nuclear transport factor 2 family protein [Lactobacillus sp. A27]MBL1060433.1 nuclear transport factor 2 family protein [Lactobacillus sp. A27]
MRNKEQIIRAYFKSWIKQDISVIKNNFAENIIYSECYGPIYRNKSEVLKWFKDCNQNGKVLLWNIKQIILAQSKAVVEWHFKCNDQSKINEFDVVSLITFNKQNQIIEVKEFKSDSKHYFPYS